MERRASTHGQRCDDPWARSEKKPTPSLPSLSHERGKGWHSVRPISPPPPTPTPPSTQDKLPTPYGLVRSGVAPDHADTKNVTNQFDRALADARVRFWGGVHLEAAEGCVGGGGGGATAPPASLSVPALRRLYSAVVLAHGAEGDARLAGVPGGAAAGTTGQAPSATATTPPLRNVLSARDFVLWVNGHPERAGLGLDLSKVKREGEGDGGRGLSAPPPPPPTHPPFSSKPHPRPSLLSDDRRHRGRPGQCRP